MQHGFINIDKRCHWNRKPEKLQKFRQHSPPLRSSTFAVLCHGIILHKNWYFWPFCCKFSIISLGYEVRFISFHLMPLMWYSLTLSESVVVKHKGNSISYCCLSTSRMWCGRDKQKQRISFICWTTKASTQKRKVHSYEVHSTEVS